jgi:hypothetical protein
VVNKNVVYYTKKHKGAQSFTKLNKQPKNPPFTKIRDHPFYAVNPLDPRSLFICNELVLILNAAGIISVIEPLQEFVENWCNWCKTCTQHLKSQRNKVPKYQRTKPSKPL